METKIILKKVDTCAKVIESLSHNQNAEENNFYFHELSGHISCLIQSLGSYVNSKQNRVTSREKESLVFYLAQMISSFSLFCEVLKKERQYGNILQEARQCVQKQMGVCLTNIKEKIEIPKSYESSGNFIKWMDTALENLHEISSEDSDRLKLFDQTRNTIEEVISHALSIAQVAFDEDRKILKGSSQAVIETLNLLKVELEKDAPNKAMANLFIDTCKTKLCNLERRVDIIVLKLCLKIFSCYKKPLERIETFCLNGDNRKKTNILDGLIMDFDLHVDRIMQIGLFAVSCSNDKKRGVKIRSCMASLESLETELVPTFSIYLAEGSQNILPCCQIYRQYWMAQATELKQQIYHIIDPFAFCQIIYEEVRECNKNLRNCLNGNLQLKIDDVILVANYGAVLVEFVTAALTEIKSEAESAVVRKEFKVCKDVVYEVKCATQLLFNQNATSVESFRVFKRCKILESVIKKMWLAFSAEDKENKSGGNSILPTDSNGGGVENNLEEIKKTPNGSFHNRFLDHLLTRGNQILKDRSILYRTPQKTFVAKKIDDHTQSLKLNVNRFLSFRTASSKGESSLDLQLTEILGELTNMSTTFNHEQVPTTNTDPQS